MYCSWFSDECRLSFQNSSNILWDTWLCNEEKNNFSDTIKEVLDQFRSSLHWILNCEETAVFMFLKKQLVWKFSKVLKKLPWAMSIFQIIKHFSLLCVLENNCLEKLQKISWRINILVKLLAWRSQKELRYGCFLVNSWKLLGSITVFLEQL